MPCWCPDVSFWDQSWSFILSLSGSLTNWNGFMLCLVRKRMRERGRVSGSFRQPTLHFFDRDSSSSSSKNYPLTPAHNHLLHSFLWESTCVCVMTLAGGPRAVFFSPPEAELIIKIDLHIKSLREKHVLLPPSPPALTLHPPIIILAGGRRLQFLSIQTGNASK